MEVKIALEIISRCRWTWSRFKKSLKVNANTNVKENIIFLSVYMLCEIVSTYYFQITENFSVNGLEGFY